MEKKYSFSKIGEKSNNTFNVPSKLNPIEKIGRSFEGREINVFKINGNYENLPAVIIDAGKI